jgi:hypothetical protein
MNMECKDDLCKLLQDAIDTLQEAMVDANKCQHKGNRSAGVRLRKTCQDVRAKLVDVRKAVQELKSDSEVKSEE